MSDDLELEDDISARAAAGPEGAAAAVLALGSASRARADAFLDEQTAIARVQREHLHEQRNLQLSHLEWRRFNDWMRAGWQAGLALLVAVAVAAIATALWDACHANGLVVDAFTVPPDFEQRGLGGDVVAGDITGRLAAIRQTAMENSYSVSSDVSQGHANDIKVEIPDTGISIAEAWRYLRRWLGSERHLAGSLREDRDEKLALTASLDGGTTLAATGAPADLPRLEQQLAENIFGAFDPVNHINYLSAMGRHRAAYEAATRYVPVAKSVLQRSDSYGLWSYTTAYATGDIELALARAQFGIDIDPDLAVLHVQAFKFYGYLGRDEGALREARAVLPLKDADQIPAHRGGGFAAMQAEARNRIAWLTGDFAAAPGQDCIHRCTSPLLLQAAFAARLHDVPRARRFFADALAAGAIDPKGAAEARYYMDAGTGNGAAAKADASAARKIWMIPDGDMNRRFLETIDSTTYAPMVAEAEARAGRFAAAHAEIGRTPRDCVRCLTVRGVIASLEGNPGAASFWYARAIAAAPSIPFAYADRGEMLLRNGDFDGAIAKFAAANSKGPHFADPLEMWGEALMQKNRSDLALAKFEEANKYAPNWGRLHVEWGKALMWSGDKAGAHKQFTTAAVLELSASEKSELLRMSAGHD
ncbi:MAG TPA: hypothetical protein VGL35_08345 [Rhizomicrobium sp.]|jgi:tetratricopeptide (TPR) repeat protein